MQLGTKLDDNGKMLMMLGFSSSSIFATVLSICLLSFTTKCRILSDGLQ
jgi:hypothetical protein